MISYVWRDQTYPTDRHTGSLGIVVVNPRILGCGQGRSTRPLPKMRPITRKILVSHNNLITM